LAASEARELVENRAADGMGAVEMRGSNRSGRRESTRGDRLAANERSRLIRWIFSAALGATLLASPATPLAQMGKMAETAQMEKPATLAQLNSPAYSQIVGNEYHYRIAPGDTLGHVAVNFGLEAGFLATVNEIADPRRLRVGTSLLVSTRRIVPARDGGPHTLVINLGDQTLYWFEGTTLSDYFPVAIGKEGWETPTGEYAVTGRRRDPVWHVPRSIQREMKAKGIEVKTEVPPGPDNPLGRYWISLSGANLGLHGTNRQRSLGKLASHGCLRLSDEAIEKLYKALPTGTPVFIVNEPIKLARTPDTGRVFLEVHPDPYPALGLPTRHYDIEQLTSAAGIPITAVNWDSVRRALPRAWGIAVDVSAE
jgi:L,D-transpeptidase ErfK/SrfK